MKKGTRIFIYVLLLFCILGFCFTYYFLYGNKEISGEKLTDGVYLYKPNLKDTRSITVSNNTIYTLVESKDNYELFRTNIYSNKTLKVGDFDTTKDFCYLENKYIYCLGQDKKVIYNFKSKKIYEGKDDLIIPYKKDIIRVNKGTIYYKDKKYDTLDIKEELFIGTNYVFDDNAYLNINGEKEYSCFYNFNNKKCEDYKYIGMNQYSNGLIYYDEDKLYVTSLDSDKVKEYKKTLLDEYYLNSYIYNNYLFYFSDDYLKAYNLENDKVKLLDHRLNILIDKTFIKDNLLYIVTGDNEIYLFNLDEIKLDEERSFEELDKEFDNRINERLEKIKNEYSVEVLIKDKADLKLDFWKTTTDGEERLNKLMDSIDELEEVLERFGKDFFKEFIHNEYKGIRIYIVTKIESDDSVSGLQFKYYDTYTMVVDTFDFKRTLYHELMHTMEDALDVKGKNAFNKWSSYNPKKYKYVGKYNPYELTLKYSDGYFGEEDVYFIDNYAQTNELEDKARIFENIAMNTPEIIKKNPKLLEKSKYLVSELIKYYPMLENSTLFDSLK